MHTLKGESLYSNWLMLSHDGEPMCRCSEKRACWYLDRGLALMPPGTQKTIRLLFPHNGSDRGDEFSLSEKDNLCVVCGCGHGLTKHHVVPYMYRRHFPVDMKAADSHDVLLICASCHETYERWAGHVKLRISAGLGVSETISRWLAKVRMAKLADIYARDDIPVRRKDEIHARMEAMLGRTISPREIMSMSSSREMRDENPQEGRIVVETIGENGIPVFSYLWRRHFVTTMRPRHMPKGWTMERHKGGHMPFRDSLIEDFFSPQERHVVSASDEDDMT